MPNKLIRWLMGDEKHIKPTFVSDNIIPQEPPVHRTFDEHGNFIKGYEFEQIWVSVNANKKYNELQKLTDLEYIDYKIWEDMNIEAMYIKHLPKVHVFRGKNPNIIFHGGCLGCLSQRLHGFERCIGCSYFRGNWDNPDLHIKGEVSATMSSEEIIKVLNRHKKK